MNDEILKLTKEISGDLNRIQAENTFGNHVEFLNAVRQAAQTGRIREKLQFNTVGSDEAKTSSNPDGAFLCPSTFFEGVRSTPLGGTQFDSGALTTKIPLEDKFSKIEIPARVDKNHTTSVSGGFKVYRAPEADTVAASRAEFEQIVLEVNSLIGISYGSDELIRSSRQGFAQIVMSGFNTEYLGRLNFERLFGTGVGQYCGVMSSGALITVAKDESQASKTISNTNVKSMVARCWGYTSAVWMCNQNTFPQLSGLDGYDPRTLSLHSRPIVFDENMKTLGDLGDLLLVNWQEYVESHMGGTKLEESIHVRFINHENCYRFVSYSDGAPGWRTTLTPKNGTDTLSPFVTLEAR